jgi:protein arginine N-methyltransferase 1
VELPERVNVIVSDMRGVLPHYEHHLSAIDDARRRLLAPGGRIIPRSDTLWLACVEAPKEHLDLISPWSQGRYGLDMGAARELAINSWQRVSARPGQRLTEALCCLTLDYSTVSQSDFAVNAALRAIRPGTSHGLCLWFDTTLAEGIGFSNSPDMSSTLVYGQAFLPWPESITLETGDLVQVALGATLVGDDYVWTWETSHHAAGEDDRITVHFRQSNFFASPLTSKTLHRHSENHVVQLDDNAHIDLQILRMMDEGATLGRIAREVASRFPARFARWQDALTRVGELSNRYGQ